LPALHLIARQFPSAQRRVLTDRSMHPKAASMATLLDGTGLVHDYFWFPPPAKGANRLLPMFTLAREIRAWKPDVLIYLHEQRGHMVALRDAAFFRILGIRRLIGVPLTRALQQRAFDETSGLFEHRSEYLARSLGSLGDARLAQRSSWDLKLSEAERARAKTALAPLGHCAGLLAMSIGTKADVNDWGDANWKSLLRDLCGRLPGWGLVALGAPVERARTSELLSNWSGSTLNLCGSLPVRESGAILERVSLFIGHDSGPMHLAASVGTACAAVFSARNLPGIWFPHGSQHTVFYKKTDCAGCRLYTCVEFKKKCIASVTVEEVCTAVIGMLENKDAKAGSQSAG
jgi:heptosyltransferase III